MEREKKEIRVCSCCKTQVDCMKNGIYVFESPKNNDMWFCSKCATKIYNMINQAISPYPLTKT